MSMKIEAPWYEFNKKVKALFGRDPDIIVGDIEAVEDGDFHYVFHIEVMDHEKFMALSRVLPTVRTFGNVKLGIYLYDRENANDSGTLADLYAVIFRGNPILKDIKQVEDFTGTPHGFVRFQPEVIQFFHDDISDYNGNWSGLAQDIAKEVFDNKTLGVHFCTAAVNEGVDNKPLGEWP